MRWVVSWAMVVALGLSATPLCASSREGKTPDQQSIEALEAKANQAKPREQCFLYSQLVHQMTELSLRQYASGDVARAAVLLKQIQLKTQKIQLSMADNNKRLKDAEILLRRAAFRLNEMLHASSYEDRPLVEQTLAEVNQAQNEAMLKLFRK